MRTVLLASASLALAVGLFAVAETSMTIAPDIEARVRQFAPKNLAADVSKLGRGDRQALDHLVAAAREIHRVFMRQAWDGNLALETRLKRASGPGADAARAYYRVMAKPWDELKEHEPFVGGTIRPPGAGFYPENLTRVEFDAWIAKHPGEKEKLLSPTTIIERVPQGGLAAIRYSVAYRAELTRAAKELRAAAALVSSPTLARFLRLRADALLSDDYFDSDMAWMDVTGPLEVVIGPYETYEDSLFGYKASFEAFICVAPPGDSGKLERYKQELPFLERNLPIPDQYKNLKRGTASPISVVDVVYAAGDARSGVQTVAFNLPNDERVREAKGSKKVLLKNMMQAKYEAILAPIAGRVLPADESGRLDADSYFNLVLFHEMSHGLGPGLLNLDGRKTEVRLELKDLYSAMEEAKADVLGVYDLYALVDKGVLPAQAVEHVPWTFTAGLFRAARFGVAEAHGLGVVIQTNYLLAQGGVQQTADGRFRPVPEKFRAAITDLARELLLVEAKGDYAGAQKLVQTYGTPSPAMLARLDSLKDIPVDVDPVYTLFEKR